MTLAEEIGLWPSIRTLRGLRHLRLEAVELDKLCMEHFDFTVFVDLRVLMLYPWTYTSRWQAANRTPAEYSPEQWVLQAVLADAPPHLRIVFIGAFRIWLSRTKQESEESLQPMPLTEAKADNEERAIMQTELTQDD